MSKILVSGLCNLETSCSVAGFPIEYSPVDYNFFGIGSVPSGVGLNLSLAMSSLGDTVTLLSYAADDAAGCILRDTAAGSIDHPVFLPCMSTPQSVVLYDLSGRRRIYTDLKDMQELRVPSEIFDKYSDADAFCLCNIGFSRSLLPLAEATGKPVFTDVHCLSDIHDEYNADFMRYSDVVFLSDENIRGKEESFARDIAAEYDCCIVAVGMGDRGAMLYTRSGDKVYHSPAVTTRPVVNTVGAGDALFSAFVHFYMTGDTPEIAIDKACIFASYKIGESGASQGFIDEDGLAKLYNEIHG